MWGEQRNRAASWTEGGRDVVALLDEHARLVLTICRFHLRDPLDAEEAARQTFLSADKAMAVG